MGSIKTAKAALLEQKRPSKQKTSVNCGVNSNGKTQ
jgi:hypothetical protein